MEVTGVAPHVSQLQLDEWLAGELDAPTREQVERHLHACAACMQRHDRRVERGTAFLELAPSFSQHVQLIARRKRSTRLRMASAFAATALAAAGILIGLQPGLLLRTEAEPAPGLEAARSKGSARLGYYFKRDGRVQRGDAKTALQAGDLLRFTYSTDRREYLALLDRDQRGARVYFPADGERAAQVSAGSDVALEFSVELDDAPDEERVYALFCREAIALAPVIERLRVSAEPPVISGCALDQLVLHKAPVPREDSLR